MCTDGVLASSSEGNINHRVTVMQLVLDMQRGLTYGLVLLYSHVFTRK